MTDQLWHSIEESKGHNGTPENRSGLAFKLEHDTFPGLFIPKVY